MNDVLLSARGLRCEFGRGAARFAAVDGVDLDIAAGEVVGLVGESGSGKSSLGKLLTGLYQRSAGEVWFAGEPLPARMTRADFRANASRMQMVFQDSHSSLNPRLRIIDSLIEPLRWRQQPREQNLRAARQWLERVGLSARYADCYPHELSGGQRQRVGIARAFIAQPRLVICDEAISALDVSMQAQVVNLLRELNRETGVALLFIAHDLPMVRYLAHRTAVMYRGQLVEVADNARLFAAPLHPYTRDLLAASPVADPVLERKRVDTGGAGLAAAAEQTVAGCAYAPRCSEAGEDCFRMRPVLEQHADGAQAVSCFFPLEPRPSNELQAG